LYGDTDSLFVDLGVDGEVSYEGALARGQEMHNFLNSELERHLREEFGLESYLDLEFEKFYRHFFQPSMRGDDSRGRAKSYAALKATSAGDELEIVGLEAVRRDWTDFAREVQRTLLRMIFSGEKAKTIEDWVQLQVSQLKKGELDDQLIYRKRLSKSLDSYTSTTPPHVKAARLLPVVPRVIFYVMTQAGPQPKEECQSPLDYQHYIDKQLVPIVKTLSQHYNFSWEKAILNQQTLF
jgi:DNA polymerase-2